MKRVFLFIVLSYCLFQTCLADSPLTSTTFADVYKEIPIIQQALNASDKTLTPEMLSFLTDPNNPVDVKLSLINALGYSNDGNTNLLINHLEQKYADSNNLFTTADASELITLTYASAMENYEDVNAEFFIAHYARLKAPQSLAVRLVIGLMEAQMALDFDWQMVYRAVHDVVTDKTLEQDFNPLCIARIMEYIDGYKEYQGVPSLF